MSTATSTVRRLGNVLIERGHLTLEKLQVALAHQQKAGRGKLLGEILIDLELCTEEQVVEALAAEYGVPYARLEPRLADARIVELIPRDFIERNLVFPLFRIRDRLVV